MNKEIQMAVTLIGIILFSITGGLYFRYEASNIEKSCFSNAKNQLSGAENCKNFILKISEISNSGMKCTNAYTQSLLIEVRNNAKQSGCVI